MNVLALDTSTPLACLAVGLADGTIFEAPPVPDARHGRTLIPAIAELLARAGCRVRDLGGIAVGIGPGSYTGLRIGVTAAKTLAYAAGLRVVGLETLELIARNAPPGVLRVSVVADAQRHELYAADFERLAAGAALRPAGPTRFSTVDDWIATLAPGTMALGPGLDRLKAPLPDFMPIAEPSWHHPTASGLVAAAREALGRSDGGDPGWFLEPLYLRRSAAEDLWDRRPAPLATTPSPREER